MRNGIWVREETRTKYRLRDLFVTETTMSIRQNAFSTGDIEKGQIHVTWLRKSMLPVHVIAVVFSSASLIIQTSPSHFAWSRASFFTDVWFYFS